MIIKIEKYQPSSGTEGQAFFDDWCRRCSRDKAMREGADFDECDDNELCPIIADTMRLRVDDPDYPEVGGHVATKTERAEQANQLLAAIAGCGRKFFAHNGRVSRFEVDDRGRIWFVDAYREAKIYTACKWSRWRGFSEGGTLLALVLQLCDFIRSGTPATIHLGPWPDWVCGGDLWGYGGDMETVRQAAQAAGVVPSND